MARSFIESISGSGVIDRSALAHDLRVWNASLGEISGEEYVKSIGYTKQVLPELKMTVEDTVAEGDHVVVKAVSHAPMPDGSTYRNRYAFVFAFRDQKIVQIAAYFDTQAANTLLLPLVKSRQLAAEGAS